MEMAWVSVYGSTAAYIVRVHLFLKESGQSGSLGIFHILLANNRRCFAGEIEIKILAGFRYTDKLFVRDLTGLVYALRRDAHSLFAEVQCLPAAKLL